MRCQEHSEWHGESPCPFCEIARLSDGLEKAQKSDEQTFKLLCVAVHGWERHMERADAAEARVVELEERDKLRQTAAQMDATRIAVLGRELDDAQRENESRKEQLDLFLAAISLDDCEHCGNDRTDGEGRPCSFCFDRLTEAQRELRDTTWQDHADHWQKRAVKAERELAQTREELEAALGEDGGRYLVELQTQLAEARRMLKEIVCGFVAGREGNYITFTDDELGAALDAIDDAGREG